MPGRYGIGELGPHAFRFIDFLAEAGVKIWQVLPLGPTGYGNSPYQCLSAFAGNPWLISLEVLANDDLLSHADVLKMADLPDERVDFQAVAELKKPILRDAYELFRQRAGTRGWDFFLQFCRRHSFWLEDYALFRALKEAQGEVEWTRWEPDVAGRDPGALRRWASRLQYEIEMHKFLQYLFFRQWSVLKRYCQDRGVKIMGDVPIFVAHDSAEVWAHRQWFELKEDGRPAAVAGVPPDYFSDTGQLWGNPLYRWDLMAEDGYSWWVQRMKQAFAEVDLIRLDHFRGFEAYWRVPAGEKTAVNGKWVKGPGARLFEVLRESLGELPLVAENLGVITPEVENLRRRFGFPGMAILQFAFGTDYQSSDFIPHNLTRDVVFYTGTHDNDTVVGWWNSKPGGGSTRQLSEIEREKKLAVKYLNTDGREIHWDFIRAVLASVAQIAIVPAQDLIGLGNEARMNLPGRPDCNWMWRCRPDELTPQIQERLRELIVVYGREVGPAKSD